MSWLDDIQKELEKSRNHPVRKKKEWEIDREIRLNGDFKTMSERAKKNHQNKLESGWYDANKKKYQEHAKNVFHDNLTEEQEAKRREGISIANKKNYKEGKTNLIPGKGAESRRGVKAENRIFQEYQVLWIRDQYNRKKDVFGKKIVYQRIADALGCSVFAIYNVIKKNNYKEI